MFANILAYSQPSQIVDNSSKYLNAYIFALQEWQESKTKLARSLIQEGWESDREFVLRKEKEMANGSEDLRIQYLKARNLLESELYMIPPEDVGISASVFDRERKCWIFSVSSKNKNLPYREDIIYSILNSDDIRKDFTQIDSAIRVNRLSATISYSLKVVDETTIQIHKLNLILLPTKESKITSGIGHTPIIGAWDFNIGNRQLLKSHIPTVALLTDSYGIGDKAYNESAMRGILSFYGDTWERQENKGKLYDVVIVQTQDMCVPILKQVSDGKHDLVIVTGFFWADAIIEVAPQYPNQKYLIVDVDWIGEPNVMEATFSEHEGSFLVGVAAALKAQSDGIIKPKFGFIGGIPGPTITKFEMGWVQGIKSILPEAEIVDYYANDWGRPYLAKTQAEKWFDYGIYAIFSVAGSTGYGPIAQAKEHRAQGKNVWAIGVDIDQYDDGIYSMGKSAVLTSMIKCIDAVVYEALNMVYSGTFKGSVFLFNLKLSGVDFSKTNQELNLSIINKVNDIKKDIILGIIQVIPTYRESIVAGVAPLDLQASDE
jgi:basic membrane protein A